MQAEAVVVTAGTRFAISGLNGDIDDHSAHGFYAFDTRFLSLFQVSLQSRSVLPIGSGHLDHSVASFYSINGARRGLPQGTISIARDRYVADGMHEDVNLVNHSTVPRNVRLELTFDVDFADLFEVRRGTFRKTGHVTLEHNDGQNLCFVYRRASFERRTIVELTGNPTISGHVATYDLTLLPKQRWKACVTVLPVVDEPPAPMKCVELVVGPPFGPYHVQPREPLTTLHGQNDFPLVNVPELQADDANLASAYEAAIADLRSLRMEYVRGLPILAAGLPWFMAVFGRDSIISAIQTKVLGQELMLGTLHTLAGLQASTVSAFRDSAPGKIPHEIRVGELSVMEETPHSRYYGTVDATPLYLRLLFEAYQWTGDTDLVRVLLPVATAALAWMDTYGDIDGDGFLEYQRRTRHGLRNQGWKDSYDSISFADGTLAEGPIALAEVQGYAYDAKKSLSALYRVIGDRREASRLDQEAERLRRAFNQAFWMPREGFYAIALDGKKRQVDSIASNPGHCLWSGIVDNERAGAVVERLMSPDMFSGWGVRTLSTDMALYNPLSYHNGSVWPHDNSLIAAGMARYGFRREAAALAGAMIDTSAGFLGHRLPELFAGYPRREHSFPVPYPAANAPQAWACGAVIYLLETLLGAGVRGDKLTTRPIAGDLGRIHLRGVRFRGMRLEL